MTLDFTKTQTIGNDFVLVDERDVAGFDLAGLTVELCNRRWGVGSDGLLVVAPHPDGLTLRMFNPDGSEDFCGNGLRCALHHAWLEGWVGVETAVWHGGRLVAARVDGEGLATITLPPADFSPGTVPVLSEEPFIERPVQGLVGTAVSTGSAHFVVLVDELPGDEAFERVSPRVEHDPLFPDRVSVIYAKPVGAGELRLRIWERGIGETMGCGTGSVAAAVVWARKTGVSGNLTVANPGGDLQVWLDSWDGPVTSSSRPQRVFSGTYLLSEARLDALRPRQAV